MIERVRSVEHGRFQETPCLAEGARLALSAHRIAAAIRGSQYASLKNQLIRAAMSIPTNIVEGRGQKSERDFVRFLRYALNSTAEFEYHVIMARDTSAIRESDAISLLAQAIEVRKMLHGLITRLESGKGRPTRAKVPSQ